MEMVPYEQTCLEELSEHYLAITPFNTCLSIDHSPSEPRSRLLGIFVPLSLSMCITKVRYRFKSAAATACDQERANVPSVLICELNSPYRTQQIKVSTEDN